MEPQKLDPARLWAAGAATALVAALVAVVGLLVARGLVRRGGARPEGPRHLGQREHADYALVAAVALAATGLMHLLIVAIPAPERFFGWIIALVTVIAVVLPLTLTVNTGAKVATALINLAIGVAIGMLVGNAANNARPVKRRPPETLQYPRSQYYPE